MQRIFAIIALLGMLLQAPLAAAKPERIVSLGLCTDQLLLLLAERAQIASLSVWAVDNNMSYLADEVGDIPLNRASIEEILRFRPDLVVASDFVAWDTVRMLRQLGVDVRQLPVVTSVAQIYAQLAEVGAWVGNPQRAQALIDGMQLRLRQIRETYAGRPRKSVIVYSPNGYTIGADTLENDLFEQAGYRNLAAEMGIRGFQPISLERVIAADPDVLQIDRSLSPELSLATAALAHPALDRLLQEREFLDIPTRLRICAGPMVVDAIEDMAARR